MAQHLAHDSVWLDKYKYDDAEKQYLTYLNRDQIAQGDTLGKCSGSSQDDGWQKKLLQEHAELKSALQDIVNAVRKMEARLSELERVCPAGMQKPKEAVPKKATNHVPAKKEAEEEEDDDVDLFGSEEDEEADKAREERLKAYHEKKSKKPQVVAKSSIVLDIKPWDDETNMKSMEVEVRKIAMEGLIWGVSKLVPLAYGIQKLQIVCVVEDDKVSIDELQEKIEAIEELVQSVDIAAFNKI
ncbi:elongation factor 1-beta isoform X2 [Ixodes scapularis]|uniref:elongation factor 1-beta isoform X2 n=1 Tax=Ixodes scapularis TaxID=6945 RepID=UPI001C37EAAA|nr:elongation factor 1-beta isoform X2 [Ixodes scapularis]